MIARSKGEPPHRVVVQAIQRAVYHVAHVQGIDPWIIHALRPAKKCRLPPYSVMIACDRLFTMCGPKDAYVGPEGEVRTESTTDGKTQMNFRPIPRLPSPGLDTPTAAGKMWLGQLFFL